MTTSLKGVALAGLVSATATALSAQEPLDIVFTHHSSASNTFWQAVQKGFDDACAKLDANCQMIFTQTEGSVQEQLANMETALAREPDALITSIVAGVGLLGGFDLVPEVVEQMQNGYVQVQVDQQPYMQGFMPVMQVYLARNFGLAPADIDTGQGIVTPDMADGIMDLAAQGVR